MPLSKEDAIRVTINTEFIYKQIAYAIPNSKNNSRYERACNKVLNDIFDKKKLATKILDCRNVKDVAEIVVKVGYDVLLKLVNYRSFYGVFLDLIEMQERMMTIKKEIATRVKKGKKRNKNLTKEFKKLDKLYDNAIKAICKSLGIKEYHKRKKSFNFKSQYENVAALLGDKKSKKRNRKLRDLEDSLYDTARLGTNNDDYGSKYVFDDDYDSFDFDDFDDYGETMLESFTEAWKNKHSEKNKPRPLVKKNLNRKEEHGSNETNSKAVDEDKYSLIIEAIKRMNDTIVAQNDNINNITSALNSTITKTNKISAKFDALLEDLYSDDDDDEEEAEADNIMNTILSSMPEAKSNKSEEESEESKMVRKMIRDGLNGETSKIESVVDLDEPDFLDPARKAEYERKRAADLFNHQNDETPTNPEAWK